MTPNNAEQESRTTPDARNQCVVCVHFQKAPANTGFCRFHKMYVLHTFYCHNFAPARAASNKGGDVLTQAAVLTPNT